MAELPHYHINVFWSPDDTCWVADIPDLRPCSALADDPVSAVEGVLARAAGWIDLARANDLPVPSPCYSPSLYAAR